MLCIRDARWKDIKSKTPGHGFKISCIDDNGMRNGADIIDIGTIKREVMAVKRISNYIRFALKCTKENCALKYSV